MPVVGRLRRPYGNPLISVTYEEDLKVSWLYVTGWLVFRFMELGILSGRYTSWIDAINQSYIWPIRFCKKGMIYHNRNSFLVNISSSGLDIKKWLYTRFNDVRSVNGNANGSNLKIALVLLNNPCKVWIGSRQNASLSRNFKQTCSHSSCSCTETLTSKMKTTPASSGLQVSREIRQTVRQRLNDCG